MDNRIISIASEGKGDFDLAMQLAMTKPKSSKLRTTIGYRVYENKLVLYWAPSDSMVKLPYAMTINETINFAWGWLEKTSPTRKEPGHDGSNGKGFCVFNEACGRVFGEWEAFIAIEPIWAIYSK